MLFSEEIAMEIDFDKLLKGRLSKKFIDPLQALPPLQLCSYQWMATGLTPQFKMMVNVTNTLL